MVMTRAQARRARQSDGEASDTSSAVSVHDVSSDDTANVVATPRHTAASSSATPLQKTSPHNNAKKSSLDTTPVKAVDPPAEAGERLGRGCRVSRTTVSLDEQYLATSLSRSHAHHRLNGRDQHHSQHHVDEAFAIHRRYPMREAAKRAMDNLRVTLTSANGAAGLEQSGDHDTEENSNSLGAFNFRHHPEIKDEIERKHKKKKKARGDAHRGRGGRRRRHRRRGSDSSASDDGSEESSAESSSGNSSSDNENSSAESDTSSSSTSADSDDDDDSDHNATRTAVKTFSAHAAVTATTSATASSSPRNSGAAADLARTAPRRSNANHDDAVSLDSSITDASLREESVERMAMQDTHAKSAAPFSASSSDGGDGTRDFVSEAERKRALRNARESTNENVNINYYMADAVGPVDAAKIRRRQLDRRYRWLLYQEEEARARGDGSGIGNISSGGGGGGASADSGSAVTTANGALGDILPLRVDDGITFDSVGGLPEHIVTLREMVLLPLLYPDLFERLDLKAPRGVLFVGPPGTGKTLMARALANEGSRFACQGPSPSSSKSSSQQQQQRITFFVRKGADMLSKWVGESERQLKLLFEEAKRLQPSIIFFDEVDGLAPTRHTKTEQTQAALVSTLLALMDGLEDRGQVVVIGATNRPDTLDPALRRPGRFDRELIFPLPDAAARRHILTIQLAKKAMPEAAEQRAALLDDLVSMTEGYSGADLGALCTEASLHRLRTALPQLYLSSARLIVPPEIEQRRLHVRAEDFYAAAQLMQPSLRRCRAVRGSADASYLDAYVEVLLRGTRDATLAALAPSWSLVEKVLRAQKRDCRDMATAVRALCAVPIPQPPRPCLLILQEKPTSACFALSAHYGHHRHAQRRALQLHHLAVSILKGLPGLNHLTVNLPELSWDGNAYAGGVSHWGGGVDGGVAGDYLGNSSGGNTGADAFTHMAQVVQSVRQCSPCVVYLSGVDAWLGDARVADPSVSDEDEDEDANHTNSRSEEMAAVEDGSEDAERRPRCLPTRRQRRLVQMLAFYLNMLADTDVILLLPCASVEISDLLFGQHVAEGTDACETGEGGAEGRQDSFPEAVSTVGQSRTTSSEFCSVVSIASPSSPVLVVDPPAAVTLTRLVTPPHLQHQQPSQLHHHPQKQQQQQQPLLQVHPQFSIVQAAIAATPLPEDLRRFVEYVHRIVAMTLLLHRRQDSRAADEQAASSEKDDEEQGTDGGAVRVTLREDTAPLPSPLAQSQLRARRRADHVRRCHLWRKVEYRRLQLRHVLMKWVSQYINSGKFKLLASADLDLATDNPLYKAWREHTRRHRIGLQDILEKIEDEAYVCLSQYHDDIDQLVRNVRSFFRTRAAADQRYRLKALDLKETCLLNMYKLNREVIRFCEETRQLQEPSSSDSDDEEREGDRHVGRRHHRHRHRDRTSALANADTSLVRKDDDPALLAEQARRAVSFSQRPGVEQQTRKRARRTGYRERRRRVRPRTRAPAKTQADNTPQTINEEAEVAGQKENGGEEENGPLHDVVNSNSSSNSGDEGGDSEAQVPCQTSGIPHGDAGSSEDEREDNGRSQRHVDGAMENGGAVEEEALTAQDWACRVLSTFTYTRLYAVFKSVMRGLEAEARLLDDGVAAHSENFRPVTAASSLEQTGLLGDDTHVEGPPRKVESFEDSVFRKLLRSAVEE